LKTDFGLPVMDVRYWHKADMPRRPINVGFRGQSGHHQGRTSKKPLSGRVLALRLFIVLSYAPQHASRINDHENAHGPGSIRRWLNLYTILDIQFLSLDLTPPSIDVLYQQMHHEIVGVIFVIEILQQEARVSVPKVCQVV
jgi:hypothetical protein